MLVQPLEQADTYENYVQLFDEPEQPLATLLVASLKKQGVDIETLSASADAALTQEVTNNSAAYWAALLQALRLRGQQQSEQQRRQDFASALNPAQQEAYLQLLNKLDEQSSFNLLATVATTPINRLALRLSPLGETAYLRYELEALGEIARQVVAENYAATAEEASFITTTGLNQEAGKALLNALNPDSAAEALRQLAIMPTQEIINKLNTALKSNAPLTFALVERFRQRIADFVDRQPVATAEPLPTEQTLRGLLKDQNGKPLANAGMQFTQMLSSGEQAELGTAYSAPDGGFALRLRREYNMDGDDQVSAREATVQLVVFIPGTPIGEAAPFTQRLTVESEDEELVIETGLPAELPPPASKLVSEVLPAGLPPALQSYLTTLQVTSLSDVRQAGGLLSQPDAAAWSEELLTAARTIDAQAQFELVSTDYNFTVRVINEGGFYSPAQLVSSASRDEFVALLGGSTEAEREQARTFYEQTAVVNTVLQALGLATGAELASGVTEVPQAKLVVGGGTGPIGPVGPGPLTSYVPGSDTTQFAYSPAGQCDCPACRSAVSPTAYLASLLNYAAANLRSGTPLAAVSVQQLQSMLLQPFCDLPVSCQFAEQSVCRYRLIIEVLRKHLRAVSPTSTLVASGFRSYLTAVYEALAEGAGTSTREIAQANSGAARKALASRLGILPGTLFNLQQQFNAIPDSRPLDEVEASLEEYFGLVSTNPLRDPLSTGLHATPVVRLSLQGAQWGLNVSLSGTVTVQVLRETGKPDRLLLHRNNDTSPDEVVASGQLVADATPATTFRAVLYPQHDSVLRGSAVINGPLAGLTGQTYQARVIPRLTTDRLRQLERDWQQADFTAKASLFNEKTAVPNNAHVPSWNGYQFLIDPDVIGPDDFRPGVAGGISATTGQAYAIWAKRLDFLQQQFTGVQQPINSWVATLTDAASPVAYSPVRGGAPVREVAWALTPTTLIPYSGLGAPALLMALQADVEAGDATRAAHAAAALGELGLPVEALLRLNELRAKLDLKAEEKEEALNILRQTLKKTFEATWADEEVDVQDAMKNITLSGRWFQRAVHEPVEGAWFPLPGYLGLGNQIVDPQKMTPLDLPDPGLGDQAIGLWRSRADVLKRAQQAIFNIGVPLTTAANRANAMLGYALLGDLSATYTLAPNYLGGNSSYPAPPYATLEAISAAYKDPTDGQHNAALNYVTSTMGLTLAELDHLIDLRSQVLVGASESLWQEMAALITRGWKQVYAYQVVGPLRIGNTTEYTWTVDNPDVGTPASGEIAGRVALVYKQKLVKWRASAAARVKWVAALDQAFQRPLVDPDQLVPGDFHQAGKRRLSDPTRFANPAFELYYQRDLAVNGPSGLHARTAADWSDNGNVLGIPSVLRVSQTYLEQLYAQYTAQVDVAGELARLNLTGAGLTLLLTAGADQAADVRHLLVQVQRARLYADWSREEVALSIYQSPLYFRQVGPQSPAPDAQAKPWRTSVLEWRAWHQDLSARYDQADALAAAAQQAVKATEDQCLPLLRDALADAVAIPPSATTPATPTRQDKLAYLGSRYLLDFEIACCQNTTRVGQAIEVLQKLFFNLQNGLSDATSNMVLASGVAATFPQAWQWLSSYEQWRSLMFLYLYPQNVLLPGLKPNQTTLFRQIVRGIRQNAQVNPADACGYMHDYQAYLDDLGSLQVAGSVETYIETQRSGCFISATEQKQINMQVALSGGHKVYANISYLDDASIPPIWNAVPGSMQVERIVGCATYQNGSNERHFYVFAFLRSDPNSDNAAKGVQPTIFGFQRFNLISLSWEDDYFQSDIAGEGDIDFSSVKVAPGAMETWAPVIMGLRNRREVDMREFPLSIPVTASTPFVRGINIFGCDFFNYDLFLAVLNADGKRLQEPVRRIIYMVGGITLLAGIRDTSYGVLVVASVVPVQHHINPPTLNYAGYINSIRLVLNYTDDIIDPLISTATGNIGWTNLYRGTSATSPFQRLVSQRIYSIINTNVLGRWERIGFKTVGTLTGSLFSNRPGTNDYGVGIGMRAIGRSTLSGFAGDTYILYINGVNYYSNATSATRHLTLIARDDFNEHNIVVGSTTFAQLLDRYEYIGPVWKPSVSTNWQQAGAPATPANAVVRHQLIASPTNTVQSRTTLAPIATGGERYVYQSPLVLPSVLVAITVNDLTVRRNALTLRFPGASITEKSLSSNLANEAYLALPLLLASELLKGKYFDEALQYFRLVYDYTRLSATDRYIYPGLQNNVVATSITSWLADPENPYLLAGLRKDSQLQFVVMNVARALLAYADSEFSRDTVESVAEARSFYELVGRLLRQDIIQHDVQTCASLLDPLDSLVVAAWQSEWRAMKAVLATVNQRALIDYVVSTAPILSIANRGLTWIFTQAKAGSMPWADSFDMAWGLLDSSLNNLRGRYDTLVSASIGRTPFGGIRNALAAQLQLVASVVSSTTQRPYVPFLGTAFCIPTNPIPYSYQLHAALGLYKIRTCRNISGIQRQLDAYAAPTDTTTGMPSIGTNGQLMQGGRLVIPATQYRYAYIVERAKQVVALAQQAEAAFLSALEKRDAEAYSLLKAKQDIAVSRANIQLQDLRVREAEDGIGLAQLQLDRNQFMVDQYSEWIDNGLNAWEEAQLIAIVVSGVAKATAAIAGATDLADAFFSAGGSVVAAIANAVAAAADATVQYSSAQASFERRNNEWTFQRDLANRDVRVNQQQITIAYDQLDVVGQEKKIAQLQLDHTQAVVSFLNTKFTNAELYAWMSQVLQGAYSYFLQQATSLAKLAELQLAFERQEVPVNIIQQDYWSSPAEDSAPTTTPAAAKGTDRKGLTGSIRLLQDVTRLDVYAFETNRRKLQLTKTVSLAQAFPTEFVRFRDTGLLSFACPQTWFDQDFPGHYLRTISRVRTSVIALVPTVDGIKARLGTAGLSRVTVAGTPFQSLTLPRPPEGVALTSAQNATGVFDLNQQSELLYPFEGLGVDVPWSFSLQKAANPNLDYDSIADVLLTVEYTALEDYAYARQIIPQLGTERTQVVALSFRNRFADQWYDLHHAGDLAPDDRYVARFAITAADLPRNMASLRLKNLSIYIDAPLDDTFTDRTQLTVGLRRDTGNGTGTSATAVANRYGLISTKTGVGAGPLYTGNAASLVPLLRDSPVGDWVLTAGVPNMTDALRQRLVSNRVNDIYLILEVAGDAPAYTLL